MYKLGDTVEATNDGAQFKKGTIGTVNTMFSGDSELYLVVKVEMGGTILPPSLSDYWKVIPAPSRRRKFK